MERTAPSRQSVWPHFSPEVDGEESSSSPNGTPTMHPPSGRTFTHGLSLSLSLSLFPTRGSSVYIGISEGANAGSDAEGYGELPFPCLRIRMSCGHWTVSSAAHSILLSPSHSAETPPTHSELHQPKAASAAATKQRTDHATRLARCTHMARWKAELQRVCAAPLRKRHSLCVHPMQRNSQGFV